MARVQRRERVLEDHLHLATQRAHRLAVERGEVAAVEADGALGRLEQLDHRAAGRGLAAAAQQYERGLDREIGCSTTTPAGTDERTTGEEGVVQHGEGVGRWSTGRAHSSPGWVARREVAHLHALGFEGGIEVVVHDAAVAHRDEPRVLPGLGGDGPPPGAVSTPGSPSWSGATGR